MLLLVTLQSRMMMKTFSEFILYGEVMTLNYFFHFAGKSGSLFVYQTIWKPKATFAQQAKEPQIFFLSPHS